jgi:uncharacterized phosphatase
MTTIVFVRHGETEWNRQGRFQGTQDIPLNEEGRRQARRLAEAWDEGGDLIVSSPLSRARETAEILASALGLTVLAVDPRLIEREYGSGAGLTLAERRDRFPDGAVPGVESIETIKARGLSFLDSVSLEHPGRRIVAVSHGGFINAVLALVSGGQLGTGKTFLGNASVSTVILGADGWSVEKVGKTFEAEPLGLKE